MLSSQMTERYEDTGKIITELPRLTPDIIRGWNTEIKGDVFLVKRLSGYICPLSDEFVTEGECRNCVHNFGDASPRHIYCVPKTKKQIGVRTARKKE